MHLRSAAFKLGITLAACALGFGPSSARAWQSDNGNGTFNNPVLYADYPDPDIIRVTNDFYMVSTTFVDTPGITVLHSKDLVNWEIISHVATNLDGGNNYNMIGGTAYQGGFWASSIRYYNGTFYLVANPTFANSRIYYTTNIAGPWQYYPLNQVTYDPGLFIETNGAGYIIAGHGPQSVFVLNSNFSQVLAVSNNVVDSGGEGSHVVKRGNYYYLFNANPGTWPYQLRCSRATNIFGPWETGHICLTETSGGHQGAIVDVNDSDQWYGFVHQDSGSIGRMPRIGPVFWENNWPVFGTTSARDQMAASYPKPIAGQPLMQPPTSDDFSGSTLGLQWQWNHNPDNTRWSLTERPGFLRLRPTLAPGFWTARNTLTQKGQGPQSYGIVKLDLSGLQPGDIAGFGTLGKVCGNIAVNVASGGAKTLSTTMIKDQVGSYTWATGVTIAGNTLYVRTDLNFASNLGICSYSLDGANWTTLGGTFELMWGYGSTFQGEKFAIFCYNTNTAASTGYVDVDSFTFGTTAPLVTIQRGRPKLNAARTTFVGDNGQPLRGPFTSTEWTSAIPADQVANMKNLGFNAVHLYAESFDPSYPTNGSTAPGYHVAEVDKIVAATRTNGLYLVMTIGNGAYNGSYNRAWITNFWNLYAPRYANETHVLYEIQNEPVAWGPAYLTATTPPGALDMEIAAYNTIRSYAPNTPVLILSYAVLGGTGGANAALTDIHAFNGAVFGNTNAVWTNVAVGFHGYAGWDGTSTAVASLLSAGYPCFMTEFAGGAWGSGAGGIDVQLTGELERLGVSWLTFQHIPPTGVSDDVTDPTRYRTLVDNAGLSWIPDYGTWPVARGVFGNNGVPRATPDFTNSFLSGALRIQAEDFDTGGEGVACHDTDSANNGGQYRPGEAVDITTCNDTGGGYKVGWTANGEWLEYTIFVRNAGYYNLGLRYATPNSGCAVRVICNARDKTGTWTLPATGSFTTWMTATQQVFLEWGRQKLRLEIPTGGVDLNWIELAPASSGALADGTYRFLNAANALAMQEPSGGGNIVVTNDAGSTDRRWNLHHVGAGQYQVSSAANNWYWISGDPLGSVWWSGTGGDRCFIIRPAVGGYYSFVPAGSGLCLQTTGANPTNVTQAVSAGSANQQWAILTPSAPAFPTGLSAVAVSVNEIALTWNAVAGAASYNVKRSTNSGGPYTAIATGVAATNYSDIGVSPSVGCYYVVSAMVGGVESRNSLEATVNLPYPWITQDVGSVGLGGTASYSGGVFSLSGSGSDIWDTADGFRFVYVTNTGNCTISARVIALQNTDPWSKAGVMIRASLASNAPNAVVAVTPNNGVTFQYRSATNGTSYFANTTGLSAPYWVRLVRSGNSVTGYRSPDGTNWTQQGTTTTIAMGTTVYIGLALTSHNNSSLCAATFDNVTAPGWSGSMPPPAPTGLVAAPSDSQVTLSWTGSSAAASYNVKRAATNGGPYAIIANVATTNCTDLGLANGTTYYYVVSALNPAGESTNSVQVSATPQSSGPSAPAGLVAVAVSSSQINLSWSAVTNALSYNVKRSTTNGGPYALVAGGVIATNYPDSGLAGGTVYYYVVSAVVGGSETSDSAQATATTFSPVVGSLVHRYSFSESGGATIADSVGGPVWNGTLPNGGTLAGGQLTLASGFQQYASLPAGILAPLTNLTIMAWVNLASVSYWSHLFDFGYDTSTYLYLTPRNGFDYTARFSISTSGSGGEQKINCPVAVDPGGWHQVAVTLNAGTGILYLDGVGIGTNSGITLNPSSLGATTHNYLGRSQSGTDPYLNGSLDEFRIYSVALSPTEIAATAALAPDQLLSTNAPQLSIGLTGTNLVLTWPVVCAGYTVQSRTNLVVGDWTNVTSPAPQIAGTQWQVVLPLPAGTNSAFYRLIK